MRRGCLLKRLRGVLRSQPFEPDSVKTGGGIVFLCDMPDVSFSKRNVLKAQRVYIPLSKWTCILGTSGIGKTTFLKYLAGLLEGQRSPLHRQDVAFLPQGNVLLPWLKAEQNVVLSSLLTGEKPDYLRARELLAKVNLGNETKTYPHHLSQGMRQRVVLAQTLYRECSWILLDEPFSSLDIETRESIYPIVQECFRGKTVLHVTHDLEEVPKLADSVFVFKGYPATIEALTQDRGTTFPYQCAS